MARFNEILEGRFNRFMQKLLSMKGPASMAQLSTEMQPVFPFFNGVENRYLESWDRFASRNIVAGVAAQTAAVRWRNPPTSNTVAIFEKLLLCGNTTLLDQPQVQINPFATDYGGPTTGQRLDSRGRQNSSILVSQSGTGVSIGGSIIQPTIDVKINYDVIQFEDQEITLLPGDALQVEQGQVNNQLIVAAMWRERSLGDAEVK